MSTHRQYADLLFNNEFEKITDQLIKSLGTVANKEVQGGTLISSQCFRKNYELFMEAAKQLSSKRLELDRNTLAKFEIKFKDEVEWLKANQSKLLLEDFWKNIVLAWYTKPMWNGRATDAETHLWKDLTNLNHMVEREIIALSLEPEQRLMVQQAIVQNTYTNNGGQMNIASGNADIQVEMIIKNADFDKLLPILIELLRSSKLPADLKEDTIDIAEIANEQAKTGTPKEGILKALGNKFKEIKDFITGTDALLRSSRELIDTINKLSGILSGSN